MRYGKLIEGHPATFWEKKSGIPYQIIYMRYRSGWPLKKALTTPVKRYGIDYEGVHYDSFASLCETYGKSRNTVRGRMRNGMSLHDAITTPIRRGRHGNSKNSCGIEDCFNCPYKDCIV